MTSLGGSCGIPRRTERVYVRVLSETDYDGSLRPVVIVWVDGRRFPVVSCRTPEAFGRWESGNLVLHWVVELRGRARRDLYWERGQWFVHARCRSRNGELGRGEEA